MPRPPHAVSPAWTGRRVVRAADQTFKSPGSGAGSSAPLAIERHKPAFETNSSVVSQSRETDSDVTTLLPLRRLRMMHSGSKVTTSARLNLYYSLRHGFYHSTHIV